MRIWFALIAISLTLIPQALADSTTEPLPTIRIYAFPVSWIAAKQTWVDKYWPGAGCRGVAPVTLVDGRRGFRFIECIDELGNPPTIIWFRINSSGHVVMDIKLKE